MDKLIQLLAEFRAWFIRDRKYKIKFEPYVQASNNNLIVSRCNAIVFFNYCPNFNPNTGLGGVTVTVGNFPIPPNGFFSVPSNKDEIDMSDYPLRFTGTADTAQVVWVSRKLYEDQKINA